MIVGHDTVVPRGETEIPCLPCCTLFVLKLLRAKSEIIQISRAFSFREHEVYVIKLVFMLMVFISSGFV